MTDADETGAQRSTPLAAKLKRQIASTGPMTVRAYMAACLSDPEHGYYRSHQAIGSSGDFVTAPEISQVFGELLGLWSAVVWQQMGSPSRFQLVEVGPGRGSLMQDALRATRRVPGFAQAVRVVLVETSPRMEDMQRRALAVSGVEAHWLRDVAEVAAAPTILIANEFLDVIPIAQVVRGADGWHERLVVLEDTGELGFAVAPGPSIAPLPPALPGIADTAPAGAVLELRDLGALPAALSRIAAEAPLAGLFLDYGHAMTGFGDTLQAVRRHRSEPPLVSPGEADLTAMVDFEAAAAAFATEPLAVEPLVTQAEFLGALGIAERASRLMSANPDRAGEIELAIARLMAPQGMGTRFKVLGLRSSVLPALPGFPVR